jgi:molybdate transport system substrate-binding protein
MKQIIVTTALGLSLSTGTLTAALAADIAVLASNGVKAAVTELVPQFEKETGHKLHFTWGASNLLAKQVDGGEAFDIVVLTPALIKGLIQQGKVVDGSATDLARAGAGVASSKAHRSPTLALSTTSRT